MFHVFLSIFNIHEALYLYRLGMHGLGNIFCTVQHCLHFVYSVDWLALYFAVKQQAWRLTDVSPLAIKLPVHRLCYSQLYCEQPRDTDVLVVI